MSSMTRSEDPRGDQAAARARGLLGEADRASARAEHTKARRLLREAAALLVEAAERAPDRRTRDMRWQLALSLHRRASPVPNVPAPAPVSGPPRDEETMRPRQAARPNVTFDDVAGLEDVKAAVRRYIILPLRHPEVYRKYGKHAGGAILLHGPPGCGKTFIARAAAGESGAAFFPVHLADVLGRYVGESEKALREVFLAARAARPSIVFLDEVDAIGAERTGQDSDHGRRLLNQLLTLMDGVTDDGGHPLDGVLVIAATNLADRLDPALTRAGRFTTHIEVPLPDPETRRRVAMHRLADLEPPDDLVTHIVMETEGKNVADVEALCDEVVMARIMEEIGKTDHAPSPPG